MCFLCLCELFVLCLFLCVGFASHPVAFPMAGTAPGLDLRRHAPAQTEWVTNILFCCSSFQIIMLPANCNLLGNTLFYLKKTRRLKHLRLNFRVLWDNFWLMPLVKVTSDCTFKYITEAMACMRQRQIHRKHGTSHPGFDGISIGGKSEFKCRNAETSVCAWQPCPSKCWFLF